MTRKEAIEAIVTCATLPPQIDYSFPYRVASVNAEEWLKTQPDGVQALMEAQEKIDRYYDSGAAFFDAMF